MSGEWHTRGITFVTVIVRDWNVPRSSVMRVWRAMNSSVSQFGFLLVDCRTYFVQMPALSDSMFAIRTHIPSFLCGLSASLMAFELHRWNWRGSVPRSDP